MKFRIISMLLVASLLGAGVAWAAPPAAHPASLEQAVKQVQHQTRGHILAADTVSRGRTQVYRIKVLTPRGKVQVMQLRSNPSLPGHANRPEADRGGH